MPDLPEDVNAFAVLEDYLAQLQAGRRPDREAMLREYPELASALTCLEALEGLAPPSPQAAGAGETAVFPSNAGHMPRDFGSYELIEEIGRGGMGVVYKARQKGLDRTVAIKMILASHLASPEHVRRFQVEARAAARLHHPHIVQIHEVGQVHGQHFFAMEYVEGISLAERLAQGPVDLETAARLVSQVARAVAHLHGQGIVHRDLKPSNILLDAEGKPYVTDFGLAKVFRADSATTTGTVLGTASYMAPEQASGHRASVGPASDVYSLGAVLYELLTGQPPFRAETPLDTLMLVLSQDPPLPRSLNRHVPRSLELIALRCLAKEPAQRYASADALADDLERFLKGEALSVRPPSLVQRIWNWTRREPALASRLGVLGLFFVVETVNYMLGTVLPDFHLKACVLMGCWAVSAVVFQQLLRVKRWSIPACFVWGTLDSVLLLALLLIANGVASSLVVAYPLLIVGSGLWFRERFVWFMTGLSAVSYSILMVDFYFIRTNLQDKFDPRFDRHVNFLVGLICVAWVVAYLVQRVRALSAYTAQRL